MSSGKRFPMLPWFPSDYLTATRHMSLAERGLYTDLLFYEWLQGPLPREPKQLAQLVGCRLTEFLRHWPTVQPKFADTPAGLVNARLEQHRTKALELSEKRARIGAHGGKVSAQTRREQAIAQPIAAANGEAIGQATVNHLSPSPSPSPSPYTQDPERTHAGNGESMTAQQKRLAAARLVERLEREKKA